MKHAVTVFLFFIYFFASYGAEKAGPCAENWIAIEDEKCVRLFDSFATRQQAQNVCESHGATLVSVMSEDEQRFLTQLVLNLSDDVNVWIGAQRRSDNASEFVWNDGSAIRRYAAWASGYPTDNVGRSCVHMRSELSTQEVSTMEWVDIGCNVGNWFICQKLQIWGPEAAQHALLGLRWELRDLIEHPVPIGFIYVHLPRQPSPSTFWPSVQWTEVTSDYAGLFFRAEGDYSEPFGAVQAASSPRLTNVNGRIEMNTTVSTVSVPATAAASASLSVGATGDANHWGISFTVSAAEVRPRNTAIRIWKRSA